MGFKGQSNITVVLPATQDKVQQAITFSSASAPIDYALGGDITVGTLTGNLTLGSISSVIAGDVINFHFLQDSTGGRTITLPAIFKGGGIPSGAANLKLVASYIYDGVNWMPRFNSGWL